MPIAEEKCAPVAGGCAAIAQVGYGGRDRSVRSRSALRPAYGSFEQRGGIRSQHGTLFVLSCTSLLFDVEVRRLLSSHFQHGTMWFTITALTGTLLVLTYVVLRQRRSDDWRPPRPEWYETAHRIDA